MLVVSHKRCDECGTCLSVCTKNALLLISHIEIDHEKCTECKDCVMICPVGALAVKVKKDKKL